MNFETFLNGLNPTSDEEICASLTPSFCPEIIDLLQPQRLNMKKTFSIFMPATRDYGFDEHAHGLC